MNRTERAALYISRIREIKERTGMSYKHLAGLLGVTPGVLYNWRYHKDMCPGPDARAKIDEILAKLEAK